MPYGEHKHRKKDDYDKGVQGFDETGDEKVEVRGKADRTRDQQSVARPPVTLPDAAPRKSDVERSYPDHVAGHRDPVMLQEAHQVVIYRVQIVD